MTSAATVPMSLRAPAEDLPTAQLASAKTSKAPAWAAARPVDLTKSHGINLTAERLSEMAKAYDPKVDRAPINLDHAYGGPALGWVSRTWVDGGVLYVEPEGLDQQLSADIAAGKYRRLSVEINLQHQVTGGWYLEGLAVLGNAKPAVRGLPEISLAARGGRRIVLDASLPDATNDSPPSGQEQTMSGTPAPAAPAPAGTTVLANNPDNTANLSADRAALAADRAALAADREAIRVERLAARRERVENSVDRQLEALAEQIPPVLLRHGLRELLVNLELADQPLTVHLTAAGSTTPVETLAAKALLAGLRGLPKLTELSTGELADANLAEPSKVAGDNRTPAEVAIDRQQGIKDEEAVALRAKYADTMTLGLA